MAIDVGINPLDLATEFDERLDERVSPMNRLWDYYRGEAHVLYATAKFRQHFARLLNEIADNWCSVVVDSAVERLKVTGFRFGRDEDADDQAWDIWQASYLDADQVQAHEEASVTGLCYLLVEPPELTGGDLPRISPLTPLEAATLNAPEDRRRRIAGYRRFVDEYGVPQARLYLPDRWLVLVGRPEGDREVQVNQARQSGAGPRRERWEIVDEYDNTAGVVPMIEMVNKPHLGRGGESDLNPILSKQDLINKFLTDATVNSEFTSFAQKWATGIEITTGEDGRPVPREQFLAGVNELWISENEGARYGSFPVGDARNFVVLIEMLVQHIAAQTRTPPHYLTAGLGQWPSADSLRASEEGLVQKCRRKSLGYSESWEEAIRIAFLYLQDVERGRATSLEALWDPPQRVSLAAVTDAAVKARTSLDVPRKATWQMIGASPQQIAEWEELLEEEQAAAPEPPEPPTPPELGATVPVA